MSEWDSKKLFEVIGRPISGKRPAGGVNTETEGVPSLGGENILADGGVTYENLNRVPTAFYKLMPKGRLQPLDVLINKDGAQTGKVGIYAGDYPDACVNEHLFILRNKDGAIDQRFLFYSVLLPETQAKIARRITGSAQPGLNTTFVDAVEILVPRNPNEQQRIAEILSTVDAAMEQTEALIAKYQQMKAGLMHDLFTRGITAAGQLRPTHQAAPQLYKQSPLGWIPKEWDARLLVDAVSQKPNAIVDGPFGSNLKTIHYRTSGIPVIQSGYVTSGFFQAVEYHYVTEAHFQSQSRSRVNPGDIVMAKIGAQAGTCAVLPEDHPFAILAGNSLKISADNSTLQRDWLVAYLQRLYAVTGMSQIRTETAQPAISIGRLKKLYVPVPKADEQLFGVKTIHALDQSLAGQKSSLAKLRAQKQGLMQDLLTGRVPVKITSS